MLMVKDKMKKLSTKHIFKCSILKKYINHMMVNGKRQKAERCVYKVFFIIKKSYSMSGILFLYESVRLLIPAFLMVPIKLSARLYFLPTILLPQKKHNIALHEFVKSVKNRKHLERNQKISAIILDSFLQLVFDGQNTGLIKKHQQLIIASQNKTLLHYRW